MKAPKLTIKGYSVFLVRCSDGSFYSGMCTDLRVKLIRINARLETYFKSRPSLVPVTLVFNEDHIPFKEAFLKHKYLRSLTRRLRDRLIKTGSWPLGKNIREFLEKSV